MSWWSFRDMFPRKSVAMAKMAYHSSPVFATQDGYFLIITKHTHTPLQKPVYSVASPLERMQCKLDYKPSA